MINYFKKYNLALVFLGGMSLWFYGYFNPSYLWIILGSIVVNYATSFLMDRWKSKYALKIGLGIGLIFNIGILGYYKYFDFFIENVNAVFQTDFALKHIILPLGISFFTLQQLSYIIDRSWGTAPHYGMVEYLAYVSFFPQLIAGPIVLHSEIMPQFRDLEKRKFNAADFADGIILFSLGLIKKVLLADAIALFVNEGFAKVYYLDTLSAWLISLCYAVELYFDFSGYCDMAVGLGKMFRFDLPINFRSPFKSYSVPEYWQRWHYTLTRFWQTYIYTPLTIRGMRKKSKKAKKFYTIMTPMVVFLISGIWHGASWTFVIWGLCEGIATVWAQRKRFKLKKSPFTLICTFGFTVFTSAIFRSENWDTFIRMMKAMFIPSFTAITIELTSVFRDMAEWYVLTKFIEIKNVELLNIVCPIILLLYLFLSFMIIRGKNAHEILQAQKQKGYTLHFTIGLVLLTGWAIISLTQVSTFLYFNF